MLRSWHKKYKDKKHMLSPKKTYIQNCTGAHMKSKEKSANEKATSRVISRVVFYILLVAFLGVTGYVLFFSAYLKISKISINGNEELDLAEIRSVIESKQQRKLFKIFPMDTFLLANTGNLENSLTSQFRKIKKVSVVKKFPDTLEITLQERKALLVLCSGEKCFLIDENGTAYSEANFDSPEITQNHLIKIFDRNPDDIRIGDTVIERLYVQYVSALSVTLQGIGVAIDNEYWTPSLVADEIDVKISNGGELYFSTQFPLETAIKTLNIVLKKELIRIQQSDVAYIDLRTENKVFYKLTNVPAPPVEKVDNKK